MSHITENLDDLNSAIVNIKFGNNHIEIYKYDKSVEWVYYPELFPDEQINNELDKNFVHDKNRVLEVNSLSDFNNPMKLDIAKLPDESMFLFANSQWIRIQRDMIDLSTSINIPEWNNGSYSKKSVVIFNGDIYIAKKGTNKKPTVLGAHWTRKTKYDFFKKRCEVDTPKLFGHFVVSGEMFLKKRAVLSSKDEILSFFDNADVDTATLFSEDNDGMFLSSKDANANEINIWKDLNPGLIKINSIQINGKLKSASSAGSIYLECGDISFSIVDTSVDYDGASINKNVISIDDEVYFDSKSVYDGDSMFNIDSNEVRIKDNYDKINIKYKYNDDNLSKHRISSIIIDYSEKEMNGGLR